MQRLLIAALALLGGCGLSLPTATPYLPTSGQSLPRLDGAIPANAPTYLIDREVAGNIPLGIYGITTNGVTWYLEWQTDQTAHDFAGDIYCPAGCTLANIGLGEHLSSAIHSTPDVNHFHFEAPTAANLHQHLEFDSLHQPISFVLSIDGLAATSPNTSFPSSGQLATTATMPFNLVSANASAGMLSPQ